MHFQGSFLLPSSTREGPPLATGYGHVLLLLQKNGNVLHNKHNNVKSDSYMPHIEKRTSIRRNCLKIPECCQPDRRR